MKANIRPKTCLLSLDEITLEIVVILCGASGKATPMGSRSLMK